MLERCSGVHLDVAYLEMGNTPWDTSGNLQNLGVVCVIASDADREIISSAIEPHPELAITIDEQLSDETRIGGRAWKKLKHEAMEDDY